MNELVPIYFCNVHISFYKKTRIQVYNSQTFLGKESVYSVVLKGFNTNELKAKINDSFLKKHKIDNPGVFKVDRIEILHQMGYGAL